MSKPVASFHVSVIVEPKVPFGRLRPYDQDAVDELVGLHAFEVPSSVLDYIEPCPPGQDRVEWVCQALEAAALERFHEAVKINHQDDFEIIPQADRAAVKLLFLFNKNFPLSPRQPAPADESPAP